VVAAPEGGEGRRDRHPEVQIFAAALDEGLNDKAYIVPGLGDFGDRLFGGLSIPPFLAQNGDAAGTAMAHVLY
jgi:hypothetical protein